MNNNVFITEALQKLNKMSRMSDSKSLKESKGRKRRLKESADTLWYGIPGIKFIYLNNWADPLIEYKGKKIDSYIVEDTMWERFLEDGGQDQDFDAFGDYMRDNAYDVYELCELAINPDYYDESYNRKLKESIRRVLRRMNEAQMSPEDAADSATLRGIYAKLAKRDHPKLNKQEVAVLDKYGLNVYDGGLRVNTDQGYMEMSGLPKYSRAENDKINLADRARKVKTRGYGYGPAKLAKIGEYPNTLEAERALRNSDLYEPVSDLKQSLEKRRKEQADLDSIDARYDAELAQLMQRKEQDRQWAKSKLDSRNWDIDYQLKAAKRIFNHKQNNASNAQESYRRRFKR